MANETFWLIFPDKPTTKRYIDEPINFGDADFQLNRKEAGMGLDASISGGELKFRFTVYRNHFLDEILYWYHKDGFEADVKFGFTDEIGNEFKGEIDFYTADTNDFNRFDCSVILESEKLLFKRRAETKVDLFANTTIDGEFIEPLQPIPMLLQAKPIEQASEWEQPSDFTDQLTAISFSISPSDEFFQINPIQNLISSGIEDSYTFFTIKEQSSNEFTDSDFKVLTAQNTLKNTALNINKINLFIETTSSIGLASTLGFAIFSLKVAKGLNFGSAQKTTVLTTKLEGSEKSYSLVDKNFNIDIGHVERGESIWVWYEVKVHTPGTTGLISSFTLSVSLAKSASLKITSESTAYNSTPLTFRLIDVMKQVAKSISGIELNAPRYDNAGEFYDTVLTNGKLLGGNATYPFYISWEDIEKSIKGEHNADSEIAIDGRIFVGIERDFYTGDECGFFDNTQFSGLAKKANPMFSLNEFKLKYSKYQSLKENTEPNSASTIHGETIFTFANKKVENSKEMSIEWVRDTMLLDSAQRLSTRVSDDTTTQDDDTVFAIDTIENATDRTYTETTDVSHTWVSPYLSLRSNGDVNFEVIGIRENTSFVINAGDLNSGNYTVFSVAGAEIKLLRVSGNVPSDSTNGVRSTKYTYEVRNEDFPIINRTNEGFDFVLNLSTPDKYSNLRFSLQRNIRNYWNSFLATVNLYHADKTLKNTYYKNNGKCETKYAGLQLTEKEDWIPTEPIMTPIMYEQVIFANVDFSDYLLLQDQLRQRRGFIRTIDNNNRVLKLYPTKMSYKIKTRELEISGNEKFERAYMTITKQNGIITINDETKLRKLIYTVEDGNKIVLYDLERQRLYNVVYWNKISINGAYAETLEILKSWLDLLG